MTKYWLITGSTGGFGRVWAEAALARGDRVAAGARRPRELADLAARYGDALLPLRLDVTDGDLVTRAVSAALDRFGRIDVLVNNAGYGQLGMVEEVSEAQLRHQFETNFFGAVRLTRAVLPIMRRQGSGRILQISSEAGVRASAGGGAYAASKWALEGLSQSLAQEVEGFGIRITLVEPARFATGWFERGARHSERLPEYDAVRAGRCHEPHELGAPATTRDAILRLADMPDPPLRLLLGDALPRVTAEYLHRLEVWRDGADLAAAGP